MAFSLAWPATMQIEALSALVAVVWLTAILCPRLVAANNLTLNFSSRRSKEPHSGGNNFRWMEPQREEAVKRFTYREMQNIIRQEVSESGHAVDCCPTVEEMIEPLGGRDRQDMYVELYRNGGNIQRFFEYSCKPEVLDKPCRFIDWKLSKQSRCVQKYSYTYAIIKSSEVREAEHRRHQRQQQHHFPAFLTSDSIWKLDYIKVRSGCSCEITPKPKKKKFAAMKANKTKSKMQEFRDSSNKW